MLVNIFDGNWNNGYLVDGGRNLIPDTTSMRKWNDKGHKIIVTYDQVDDRSGKNAVKIVNSEGTEGEAWFETRTSSRTYQTGKYAMSFYAKSDSDTGSKIQAVAIINDSKRKTGELFEVNKTWKRYTLVYDVTESYNDTECFWLNFIGTNAIYFAHFKLERGTIATPWTPAPEDTFDLGTAHPDSIFTNVIPIKKNTQYVYGLPSLNSLPAHTIRYMKPDGTYVKAVNVNEDATGGLKSITFDDDYNIEIMFQNGLSAEQKANFQIKEENNMAIKSADQITILDVTDAYSVMLTSEAYTFIGGTGGVGANQSCSTEAVAFCGQNQCASVAVTAADIVCPTGITASVANSGTSKVKITFTTTATVNTACEATIPVVVDGMTMNKKFSFAVARTGNTGATGKGIKGTPVAEYVGSSSNTTVPTSGWSTTIPSVTQGQYLWTRVTTTYTDNTTSVSYSVAKQGSTGATGTTGSQWYSGTGITGTSTTATAFTGSGVANARVNDMYLNTSTGYTYKCTVAGNAQNAKWVYAGSIKGIQGDKGSTGATGNGISKADITYAASSSNTSAPSSGWQTTPPSVSAGQYLWTKTVFTYTNGGTATQYSVAKQGATGAAGQDAISLTITSSNGTVFKNNTGSTTLTAHVWKGSVEQAITDAGVCGSLGSIKWYKAGSDTSIATSKTLTVSAADVTNSQAYTCQLEG